MKNRLYLWRLGEKYWVYADGFWPFKGRNDSKIAWQEFDNFDDATACARMTAAYHRMGYTSR